MKKHIPLVFAATILAVTFIAFSPSLRNGFTNWDDHVYVTENTKIRSLAWSNLKSMFTSLHFDVYGPYHPLVFLSYSLEYRFFGTDPSVFHATNLALHLGNCLLVYRLFFLLTRDYRIAFIVALLFGIHPLRVESVAWVSERKDVLYAFFFLSSLIGYLQYLNRGGVRYYGASLLLFLLSLLSKPMAVTLPPVLLLLDYFRSRRLTVKLVTEKIPFFALSAVFFVLNMHFGYFTTVYKPVIPPFSLAENLSQAGTNIVFYLYKTLFPVGLSSWYLSYGIPPWFYGVVAAGAALCILCARRKAKTLVLGAAFFLVTLFPVLHLVPVGWNLVADRYTYIPLLGLFFLAGKGILSVYDRWHGAPGKALLLYCGLLAVVALGLLTRERCHVWSNGVTLWNSVLERYPDSPAAYSHRGNAYYREGAYDKAWADYAEALALAQRGDIPREKSFRNPADEGLVAEIFKRRGDVRFSRREYAAAVGEYTRALELNPRYADAYVNRASAYGSMDNTDRVIADCLKAIELEPSRADACLNLGNAYGRRGRYEEAVGYYTKAVTANPFLAQGYFNRAVAFFKLRDFPRAWDDVVLAQRRGFPVDPFFVDALSRSLKEEAAGPVPGKGAP